MSSAHAHAPENASAAPKLNWLAVLAAFTLGALALYYVSAAVIHPLEAGYGKPLPAHAAPAAAPAAE